MTTTVMTPEERAELIRRIKESQDAVRKALRRPAPLPPCERPTLPAPPPTQPLKRSERSAPRHPPYMPPPDDSPTVPPTNWSLP